MKKIFFGKDARSRILGGAEILYSAVKVTMSPKGRNVAIQRPYGHTITHDGVTVADMIQVSDYELRTGADMIQVAAGKLNNEVGDGTTTVTVLTYHLLKRAMELIEKGRNPSEIKAGFQEALDFILSKFDSKVVVLDNDKLLDVARISAGEKELGDIIGKLAQEIGADGVITVEQGRGFETTTEIRDGFVFERGYLSPFFVTDKKRLEVVLDKPTIIITNEKLATVEQVNLLLGGLTKDVKEVLLICDDLTGEAMNMLAQTTLRGYMKIAAVKAPAFGDSRLPALEDVAILTGGGVIAGLVEGAVAQWGYAEKVIVSKERTTIIKGGGKPEKIMRRVKELNLLIEKADSDFDKEKLEARRANLQGKVATIKVGGATETEIDEKKYRVDDAVAAVKAAQDGGVVAGGGVTLANLADELAECKMDTDIKYLVIDALYQPFMTITGNADMDGEKLLQEIGGQTGMGVDVTKGTDIIDMVDAGVIDPAKVTKQALNAAFSVAMTALTIDVLVVDVPDDV